jgi:hypothetical protein
MVGGSCDVTTRVAHARASGPLVGVDRLVGVGAAVAVDFTGREAGTIHQHLRRQHVARSGTWGCRHLALLSVQPGDP